MQMKKGRAPEKFGFLYLFSKVGAVRERPYMWIIRNYF